MRSTSSGDRPLASVLLTALTLVAFAGNSLLCRMALGDAHIDPLSFTMLRLVSGALALLAMLRVRGGRGAIRRARGGSWASGLTLFVYAICFSLAYVSLEAGMGALLLFGTVQVTMIGAALRSGESLCPAQWTGLLVALGGLVYLVLPGASSPEPFGALLMTVSGVGWGVYSIRGRGAAAPIAMNAGNFVRAAPLTVLVSLAAIGSRHVEPIGVTLALASGIVTTGLGYVLWYTALRRLTTTQASVVQLLVPVIAAVGGVVLLAERVSPRLVLASSLILGGVALVVLRGRARSSEEEG